MINKRYRSQLNKLLCIIIMSFLFYLILTLFIYFFIDTNNIIDTSIINPVMIGYL